MTSFLVATASSTDLQNILSITSDGSKPIYINDSLEMNNNNIANPNLVDGVDLDNPGNALKLSSNQYNVESSSISTSELKTGDVDLRYLNKAGDKITGDLNMGGNTLKDIGGLKDDSGTNCGDNEFIDGNGNCQDAGGAKTLASFTSTDTSTNINKQSWTVIPWDVQLDVDSGYTHNPSGSPGQITFDEAGTYRVSTMLSYDSSQYRINPGIKFSINGNRRNRLGLSGYSRHASGHYEASNYLTEQITVNAGDTLRVETKEYGNSGTVTLRNRESNLVIEKLSETVPKSDDVDKVDGKDAADFVNKAGDTMSGDLSLDNNNLDDISGIYNDDSSNSFFGGCSSGEYVESINSDGTVNCASDNTDDGDGTDDQNLGYNNKNSPTSNYKTHEITITGGSNTDIRDYYDPDTTADEYGDWDWFMDGTEQKSVSSGQDAGIDSGNAVSLSYNNGRDIQVGVSASGLDGSYLSSSGGELDVDAGSVLGSGNDLDSSGNINDWSGADDLDSNGNIGLIDSDDDNQMEFDIDGKNVRMRVHDNSGEFRFVPYNTSSNNWFWSSRFDYNVDNDRWRSRADFEVEGNLQGSNIVNSVNINVGAVTNSEIASSVTGDGLSGGGGSDLTVAWGDANDLDSNGDVSGLTDVDTDDLSEGGSNLYFTDERSQDAVGTIMSGSGGASVNYNDGGNSITVDADNAQTECSGGKVLTGGNGCSDNYDYKYQDEFGGWDWFMDGSKQYDVGSQQRAGIDSGNAISLSSNNGGTDIQVGVSASGLAGSYLSSSGGELDVDAGSVLGSGNDLDNSGNVGDSDKVDGEQLTDILNDENDDAIGADWNTLTEPGIHGVSGSSWSGSNQPTSAYTYGQLIVTEGDNGIMQMYVSHHSARDGSVWIRTGWNDGSWDNWHAMPTREWVNNNDANNHDDQDISASVSGQSMDISITEGSDGSATIDDNHNLGDVLNDGDSANQDINLGTNNGILTNGGNDGNHGIAQGDGSSGYTGIDGPDIFGYAGVNIYGTNSGQKIAHFDDGGNVDIPNGNLDANGLTEGGSNTLSNNIGGSADQLDGNDASAFEEESHGGEHSGDYLSNSGDTLNVNAGSVLGSGNDLDNSGDIVSNAVGNSEIKNGNTFNMDSIHSLTDTNALVFDGGDHRITNHDGNGNFNIKAGVDDNNNIVSGDGGSHLQMSDGGDISLMTDSSSSSSFSRDAELEINNDVEVEKGPLNMRNNGINNIGGLQGCGGNQFVDGDGNCETDDSGSDDQSLGYNNKNSPTSNYKTHEVTITGGSNTDIRDYYDPDTTADEYGSWDFYTDNTNRKSVSSGEDIGIDSGNAINLNWDGSRDVSVAVSASGLDGSYLSSGGGELDVAAGSVLGSGNDLDSSGNVNHGIGASLGDGRDAGSDYVTFANSGDFYIGGSSTPDASTSGIHVEANSNPSSGNPIFTVESSGGSERLRVEHGGDLYTSNNLDVDGGNIYDSGSNFFGGCSSGDYVESINSDGTVNCANDDSGGTSLTGGDGIDPSSISNGNTLSVAWGDAGDLDSSGNVDWSGASDLDSSGDVSSLSDVTTSDLSEGSNEYHTDGRVHGAVESGNVDNVQFSNIESVSNGEIGRDNSIGFLAEWGGNGNAVLWDAYNVQTNGGISVTGGTGNEDNPRINLAANDLDASGNINDWSGADDLDGSGDINSGAAGSYLSVSGGELDVSDNWVDESGDTMTGTLDMGSNGNVESVNNLNVGSINSNNGNGDINFHQGFTVDGDDGGDGSVTLETGDLKMGSNNIDNVNNVYGNSGSNFFGGCSSGDYVESINSDGTVNCANDDSGGTSLTGGDGIDPSSISNGNTLSVAWGDAGNLDQFGDLKTSSDLRQAQNKIFVRWKSANDLTTNGDINDWSGADDLDSSGNIDSPDSVSVSNSFQLPVGTDAY